MWLIALFVALLLPFPGPHVDAYVPLALVVIRGVGNAESGFWILAAVLVTVYTLAVRGIIALATLVRRRRQP
jgi:hypothetical protein